MVSSPSNTLSLQSSLAACDARTEPYRHWLLSNVFDDDVVDALAALPFDAPRLDYSTGARAGNNESRSYFDSGRRAEFPVCQAVAEAFQNPATVARIEAMCGISLKGGFLRLEFAQDRDGFWLHPHKDISVKMLSMLVYLTEAPDGECWGTDIYSGPGEDDFFAPTPHGRNRSLVFVPGSDTWHGFRRKQITGVRRSLIVNYVTDAWINRHELAFPDQPV